MRIDERQGAGVRVTTVDVRRVTWNATAIDELRALQEPGDPDLVDELVTTFHDDVVELFGRLVGDVAHREFERVHDVAHRVKGGALNLGADRLARAAAELERAAGRRDAAAVDVLFDELVAERDRFLARARRV
jgi:HPt (histidine-containing phosphotransfer) domain-containing protein